MPGAARGQLGRPLDDPLVRRFFVQGLLASGANITIEGEQHARMTRVLRLQPEADLVVFDGSGAEWPATITDVSRRSASLTLGEERRTQREPWPRLVLYQALIRPALFELVLEKGTELGVHAFVPLLCERGARTTEASPSRRERWRRIVIEAAEQSGRVTVPSIGDAIAVAEAVDAAGGQRILAWERSQGLPPLASLQIGDEVSVFIGPEGGFTSGEVERAREKGVELVGLGGLVLRSETAAIAASALLLARS